ncbi:MAG: glycosyltransferase [Flavobacteriales bacterium]|nr:glycosyltransferase [Flavobacteriales bacterium]
MITPLFTAFVAFGLALLQAMVLASWRDRIRKEGLRKLERRDEREPSSATIIVPARDAEGTLIPLLQDLNAQDVPKERVEVIVVDDNSSDGTVSITEGMMRVWSQLRLLRNEGEGKKAAITTGVKNARHGVIILTDADTRCERERVRTILEAMSDVDLLILPVRTEGDGSFVGRLQEEEQAGLLGMAAGEAFLGRPGLAYGANLAFLHSAFDAVGGYSDERYASGDDVFLVERMKKAGKRIAFLLDQRALVTVEAEPSWRGFFEQRVRWAGKMRGVRGAMPWTGSVALLLPWFLVWASMRFELSGIMEESGLETLLLLIAAWSLWIVPVIALVGEVRRFLGQRAWPVVSLSCFVLFTVYSPLITLVSFVHRPRWKGRRV